MTEKCYKVSEDEPSKFNLNTALSILPHFTHLQPKAASFGALYNLQPVAHVFARCCARNSLRQDKQRKLQLHIVIKDLLLFLFQGFRNTPTGIFVPKGPTGNRNSQFNFFFNGKWPHSLFSNLPDIRSHCIILSSPWFCWVNCFTIYFKPLSHLKKPFLKDGCYSALFSWTDVQQEVSTTTEQNIMKRFIHFTI